MNRLLFIGIFFFVVPLQNKSRGLALTDEIIPLPIDRVSVYFPNYLRYSLYPQQLEYKIDTLQNFIEKYHNEHLLIESRASSKKEYSISPATNLMKQVCLKLKERNVFEQIDEFKYYDLLFSPNGDEENKMVVPEIIISAYDD